MFKALAIDLTVLRRYILQLVPTGAIVSACMALGMGAPAVVPGTFAVLLSMLATMSACGYDDLDRWGSCRLTMPVSRRDVVLGRYAAVASLTLLGALVGMVVEAVFAAVSPASDAFGEVMASLVTLFICLVVAALISGISLPLYLRFGVTSTSQKLPLLITAALFLGAFAVSKLDADMLDGAVATVDRLIAQSPAAVCAVALAISALIWSVSAAVSLRIYGSRDL